jgi:sugar/nucleoside kinase (ribokinase family)
MDSKKISISGTGCALADFLYTGVRFNSPQFRKFLSKSAGDGGLSAGRLVFTEELEMYSGVPYSTILGELTGKRSPDTFNIGGPGLVSLLHASQLLDSESWDVKFYGSLGSDDTAEKILELLRKTRLNITGYRTTGNKPTPSTDVLSDPTFAAGHGERTFVNNIGSAWNFTPEMLDDDFFNSRIICFGGTALVPRIHDNLTPLLRRSKMNNAINVVNTVFDFRSEKKNPDKPWTLVPDYSDYNLIDVLIMDREEALRISGQSDASDAARFFIRNKVSSLFITNGAADIIVYSDGNLFSEMNITFFPVAEIVTPAVRSNGDTTGCGDNFAGGIITSLAMDSYNKRANFDLISALAWAVASGGFACTYIGGTFFEGYKGEKLQRIMDFKNSYLKQIGYQ